MYTITKQNLPHFRWQIIADYLSATLRASGFNPRLTKVHDEETDAEVKAVGLTDIHFQVGDGYYVVNMWNKDRTAMAHVEGACNLIDEVAKVRKYIKARKNKKGEVV
jgi:hypothetical protein